MPDLQFAICSVSVYGTGFPKWDNVAEGLRPKFGTGGSKGNKTGASGSDSQLDGWRFRGRETSRATFQPHHKLLNGKDGWYSSSARFQPIVLARKPLSEPTVAANVLRWRTGALNIDVFRIEAHGKGWPNTRRYYAMTNAGRSRRFAR